MYQIIDFDDFRNAFWRLGRENPFSNDGLRALFKHLEDDCVGRRGPELDVDAICRMWVEYDTAVEAAEAAAGTRWEADEGADDDANESAALEWLRYETATIEFPGGVIIANF